MSISKNRKREIFFGWFFVMPALLYFVVFRIYPMIQCLYLSFFEYDLSTLKFVGLGNFRYLIGDQIFRKSLSVTFWYIILTCLLEWPAALGLALVLCRPFRFKNFFQVTYLTPFMLPISAVAIIWIMMYHPRGIINSILYSFTGTSPIRWLFSERFALLAMVIMSFWRDVGYYAIFLVAGLLVIPKEYYEVAEIDGANFLRRFLHITLPLLKPAFVFVILLSVVRLLQTIDAFIIMTGGGPGNSTRILGVLMYDTGLRFYRMGRASAIALILFAFVLAFSLIQLRIFKTEYYQ